MVDGLEEMGIKSYGGAGNEINTTDLSSMGTFSKLTFVLDRQIDISFIVDELNSKKLTAENFQFKINTPIIIESGINQYNYIDSGYMMWNSNKYYFEIGAHVDSENLTKSFDLTTSDRRFKTILFEYEEFFHNVLIDTCCKVNFQLEYVFVDIDGGLTFKEIEKLCKNNNIVALSSKGYRVIRHSQNPIEE